MPTSRGEVSPIHVAAATQRMSIHVVKAAQAEFIAAPDTRERSSGSESFDYTRRNQTTPLMSDMIEGF